MKWLEATLSDVAVSTIMNIISSLFFRSENQVAISATEILDKCVYINIAKYIEYVFVSHLPNTVEVE